MDFFTNNNGWETWGLENVGGFTLQGSVAPVADVSRGGEDMQGAYPGTSDGGAGFNLNTLFGGLNKVLDYAIVRDQQKLAYSPERLVYAQQSAAIQTQQTQTRESGLFVKMLLLGGVVFLVMNAGGSK